MSCAAVTVNRSLILLAIFWGVIPVAALRVVTMGGTEDTVAQHAVREPEGLLPALSLAITQPNRKKAAVTNGR